MDYGTAMKSQWKTDIMEIMRSFTLFEITTLISIYATTQLQWNADMDTYDVPAAWLHRVRYRALFRALFRDTELCSYKPEFQCRIRSRINPESHRYNANTLQAVRDLSLAEQQSLKRGMTVPELQQPLPRTITVPEVQGRSTVKRIHQ
jgi:hypothetical protein